MTDAQLVADFVEGFERRYPAARRFLVEVRPAGPGWRGAEAWVRGGVIFLSPKFFRHDLPIQDAIMWHELGHAFMPPLGELVERARAHGLDLWDLEQLPYGQLDMDEAFAEAFMAYHLSPAELRNRHPAWYNLMTEVVK